jgi:hypothetical protein
MSLRRRLEQLEASAAPPENAPSAGNGSTEALYLQEIEWYEAGESGLVHDREAEVFYSQAGEFALSRDRVDVRVWLNA